MCTKLQTVRIAILLVFSLFASARTYAQTVGEALLATAIGANTVSISAEMNETNRLQAQISGENVLITNMLNNIYDYEKKMYDYMSTAQDVITSAYTIGKCFTMGAQIATELEECSKAAKMNPEGAILTFVTSKYTDILAEGAALTAYLAPIVQGNGKKNLLSSAERVNVLNTVQNRLYNILEGVIQMKYTIQRMNLAGVVYELSPEAYYQFYSTSSAYEVALDALKEASAKL